MLKNIHFIYIALMSTLLGVVPLLSAASTSEIEKLRAAAEKGDPVAQK